MFNCNISFKLPLPWSEKAFTVKSMGFINFLVGPNGSGKSRFAIGLKHCLPKCRLLGTDRLAGFGRSPYSSMFGDHFDKGYQKNWFNNFKQIGIDIGGGIDTFVLLEERLDLRIRVEATLSNLFDRRIIFEWDSGMLVPKATLGSTGDTYRLDLDECHGIKELLVLLTNLYNDEYDYLIIDEPELNLHPQFQSFFMREIHKVAADPRSGGKIVFLITHSPSMLDFRSVDDVKSVISFSLDYEVPHHILELDQAATSRFSSLVPRLNVSHKQLFFSDNPIFVEGIFDAQLIQMIQECRGVSISGAGSCVIDAGGCEEINKYLELCRAFGKKAFFLYDLDSLFSGGLRGCIKEDESITSFLATLGLGSDFGKYCGQLERVLSDAIDIIIKNQNNSPSLDNLASYFKSLQKEGKIENKALSRARVAILIQLNADRQSLVEVLSESSVIDIEGRLKKIVEALQQKNVFLLPGGALEHYLPSYTGDRFILTDAAKKAAVESEINYLSNGMNDEELEKRYGALYAAVRFLPAKGQVDLDSTISDYLSKYIHELQGLVVRFQSFQKDELQESLSRLLPGFEKMFTLHEFSREDVNKFEAIIKITDKVGKAEGKVEVTDQTNAGMRKFSIEWSRKNEQSAN
jgi:hypothetical protein